MTERDYINATNLANARSATRIIIDILALTEDDKRDQQEALRALRRFIDRTDVLVIAARAAS